MHSIRLESKFYRNAYIFFFQFVCLWLLVRYSFTPKDNISTSLEKHAESIARETTNKHSTEHLDRNYSIHNMYCAQYQLKFYQLDVKVGLGVNQIVAGTFKQQFWVLSALHVHVSITCEDQYNYDHG